MTHMVIFQSPEGTPGYHQAEDLDSAVRFVEGLRNDQDVEQARIFRMEEVPFEFRSYFRVEIDESGEGDGAREVGSSVVPSLTVRTQPFGGTTLRRVDLVSQSRIDLTESNDEQAADEDIVEAVARRGLFGR